MCFSHIRTFVYVVLDSIYTLIISQSPSIVKHKKRRRLTENQTAAAKSLAEQAELF
jgi:hypothetical protein